MSKVKSTDSTYCLLRHSRNVGQTTRGSDRMSSGGSNYNSAMQEKLSDSTNPTSSSSSSTVNRSKMVNKFNFLLQIKKINWAYIRQELSRQKSPIFNRRRASSITLARTIPNFGPPSPTPANINTSPAHNPDLYRYIKNDEQRQNTQQWNEQSHGNNRWERN